MRPLVIVGCGGFGREVHDVVDAINADAPVFDLLGFVDDAPSPENRELVEARGSNVLGPISWFRSAPNDVAYVIGIGSPGACHRIDKRLDDDGRQAATLVHPQASLGWRVQTSPGTIVCAGARLSTNIRLGRHVHVDRNCLVGHDTHIDDWSILYPGAAVAGSVTVGRRVLLGSNATLLQGLEVGDDSILAAGAVLTKNLASNTTVKGVPAR